MTITREECEHIVSEILINEGPDGHTDGTEVLVDFIEAVVNDEVYKFIKTKDYLKDET